MPTATRRCGCASRRWESSPGCSAPPPRADGERAPLYHRLDDRSRMPCARGWGPAHGTSVPARPSSSATALNAGRSVPAAWCMPSPRAPASGINHLVKGLIAAGGRATRLAELTRVTNKHLLPVGSWPMVYYPLQLLQRIGVREVLLVTGQQHAGQFIDLLGNGHVASRDGDEV